MIKRLAAALAVVLLAPAAANAHEDEPAAATRALAEDPIQLNVSGEPFTGATPYGEVRGVMDAHSHMNINLGFGENGACGKAWSPQGPAVALRDCPNHEPGDGAGAYAFNVFQTGVTGTPTVTHDSGGWPTFKGWPAWNVVLHQQVYYRWLERAWRAGLRVYVTDAVDLAAVCDINTYRTESCDETNTVRRQIRDTYALQDYIDEQAGGPGKGFFRIVTDPFQARRAINAGKLAVVLGIETSELFGCSLRNDVAQCDRSDIDRGLDEMKRLGVASSFVCHKFDNALCGVAMDKEIAGAVINSLQFQRTGRFWDIETCKGSAHDEYQVSLATNPFGKLVTDGPQAVLPPGQLPVYPPSPHCNKRGLTALGEYFVRGLIKRGMIVEVDHMSVHAREQTLTLLESERYSGVISSHSWADKPSLPRILDLGGVIAPMAGPASSPASESAAPAAACCFLDVWKHLREQTGAGDGTLPIGFADDMSGPSPQPPPRAPGMPAVSYPFHSFDGRTTIDRQHNGPRAYDINDDGVAHLGLFPDWWERLRLTAGQRVIDDLAAGAEAYLQMWERAHGVPATRCIPAHALLRRGRLRPIALGMRPEVVLRSAGQPRARPPRAFRYCAAHGRVAVVFDARGRATLIASTAPGHRLRGIRPGARASRIPHAPHSRTGVFLRALSPRTRAVYVVKRSRVAAVAIAPTKLTTNRPALLRTLKLGGIR